MLSGLNPTEGRELKADEAICRAVLLLSSLPEAVPHVFILVKQEKYVHKQIHTFYPYCKPSLLTVC